MAEGKRSRLRGCVIVVRRLPGHAGCLHVFSELHSRTNRHAMVYLVLIFDLFEFARTLDVTSTGARLAENRAPLV